VRCPLKAAAVTVSLLLATAAANPRDERSLPGAQAQPDSQRLVISALDGTSQRVLPLIGESNRVPMWSPDGKSILFQVRESGRNVIAVVQSDGTVF